MKTWWITAYTWRSLAGWICLAALLGLGYQYRRLPDAVMREGTANPIPRLNGPETPRIPSGDWTVVQPDPARSSLSAESKAAQRFRLAGTYFQFTEEGHLRQRTAYLEDTEQQKQYMLHEQDTVDDLTLVRIFSNSVSVVYREQKETLRLSYRGDEAARVVPPASESFRPKTYAELPALETNRFGKRIGENRWVFKREALLQYQQELADDAERLAQLFVSFRPEGTEQGVEGYQLNIRGEQDFFNQVGLQEKDIVREVNSMRMVSQTRAELFLREFSRRNLNMLVLDIERAGETKKLIYLIR